MPSYSYKCEKCSAKFELFFLMKDYQETPKCTTCKSNKTIRDYVADAMTQSSSVKKSDSELKTLGDLAKRNTDRLSPDEKDHLHYKHNKYKTEDNGKPLPKGMKRIKKPQKPVWRNKK